MESGEWRDRLRFRKKQKMGEETGDSLVEPMENRLHGVKIERGLQGGKPQTAVPRSLSLAPRPSSILCRADRPANRLAHQIGWTFLAGE